MNLQIEESFSLQPYNTFRIATKAKKYVEISQESQLIELFKTEAFGSTYFVLGGGSNVLFTKDYDGLIVHINNKGVSYDIKGNDIYVTAAGGMVWNDLVWYCIQNGFPGLENMALIPGTVGASPVQNIGAYGAELMSVFYECRAFDTLTGEFTIFSNSDCSFTYRDSIFKGKYKNRFIITSVTYRLNRCSEINTSYGAIEHELSRRNISSASIRDIAEVVSDIRVQKLPDPSTIGNAGSFFKNPIINRDHLLDLKKKHPDLVHYPWINNRFKLAAAWLIEQCGWKGKNYGNAGVWKNQALVLVNNGGASGKEIFELSDKILADIDSKFSVKLEREVNIL